MRQLRACIRSQDGLHRSADPQIHHQTMSLRIAVVGVGRMGANMARRLVERGFSVSAVFDSRPGVAAELAAELGCLSAGTLADVTAAADIVLTVVTDDRAMERIFSRKGDSLLKGAQGRLFINCATVSPAIHREVLKRARKAGAESLEACMASSITQARSGTLYLMVGGERAVFDRVQPLLRSLSDGGKLLRYIGPAGTAAQVKALVNMVMNINTAGLAEGLGLGAALGLDLKMLMEVFSQTGANSRVLATDGEDMVNREHSCFFSAAHAAKDSGIALDLARKARLKTPLASAALGQFRRMVSAGLGDLDKSGVAELTFKGRGPKPRRRGRRSTGR
ncbi:MAG: NAD(P)-dependent oxidoreductase [Verrucomicrobia bacterium]|nr:NAD(P)-dependent oxidoreductase [Verrucomicrobiota bacterium]